MIQRMRTPLLGSILLVLFVLVACGGADERDAFVQAPSAPAAPAFEGPPGSPGVGQFSKSAAGQSRSEVAPAMASAPAPAAPAPAAAPAPPRGAPAPAPAPAPERDSGAAKLVEDGSTDREVALVAQQRIIVRTVDMELVVADVSGTLDAVAGIAQELGGWVVSSDRTQKHRGVTSIRVPADRLDEAILRLRDLALEVEAEVSTSRDVTDEYVDTTARLTNLLATEEALLKLFEKALKVEDALKVQTELTKIQGEMERLRGRIKFLEETSAFSLITVILELAAVEMPASAGADQTISVGQAARFRASFMPPEGIDRFSFTWDFGDGSPVAFGERTAPSLREDTRFTSTITHVYSDDRDSPFIVEFEITGTGDAGLVEGSDTLIATVTKVPKIEVFAGESQIVEEGEDVKVAGSFTRPAGLTDLTFRWDFGDGSAPVTQEIGEGLTRAVATHVYPDHRPVPFIATLTVTGQSEAGEVEAENRISILVTEAPPIEVFAGGDVSADEGEEIELVGSFTRPEGVTDLEFRWEFGDGSAPVTGELAGGETNAVATHVYPDHRPRPFPATLTVTGKRGSKEVTSLPSSVSVFVAESSGWLRSGWSASDNWKTATRAISGVGQGLGTFFIWLGIFSPLWIVGGAVALVLRRRRGAAR